MTYLPKENSNSYLMQLVNETLEMIKFISFHHFPYSKTNAVNVYGVVRWDEKTETAKHGQYYKLSELI